MQCGLFVYDATVTGSSSTSSVNWVATYPGTVSQSPDEGGTNTFNITFAPAPGQAPVSNWWRADDFLYSEIHCSVPVVSAPPDGSPATLYQYTVAENGTTQPGRIYPSSSCTFSGTGGYDITDAQPGSPPIPPSQTTGFVESNQYPGPDAATFQWNCAALDSNKTIDLRISADSAAAITITGDSGGSFTIPQGPPATPFPTIAFTQNLNGVDDGFTISTLGSGDMALTGFRTLPPPPAPTNLKTTAGNAQVTLAWTASAGANSYDVFRGTAAGGESSTPVASGITTTSFTNTGLTDGTEYYFTVAAVSSNGTSTMSNEASAKPAGAAVPSAPTNLAATAGNSQVVLTWTASANATSYDVYRGTTAGGEGAAAIASNVTGTTFTNNTGLTDGTKVFYKVAAVNSAGTSGKSNEASAVPGFFLDSGGGATGVWGADADFTSGGEAAWGNAVSTALLTGTIPPQAVLQAGRFSSSNGSTFSYTFTGLAANSSHSLTLYFVEHLETAANQRQFSVTSNTTTLLTNFDIYAAANARYKAVERSFTATADGSGKIVLTFTPKAGERATVEGIILQ
jgi:hypothetical protein